jgi:hypothetical protein
MTSDLRLCQPLIALTTQDDGIIDSLLGLVEMCERLHDPAMAERNRQRREQEMDDMLELKKVLGPNWDKVNIGPTT